MNEATKTIIDAVMIFLSSSVGATILGIVGKAVANAIASVKIKKYSKLTDSDRAVIVSEVKDGVLNAIQGGVSVDMDAQIDKATSRRITAVEKSQNDIVEQMEQLMNYQRVVLAAIGDFKTISQSSKEQIQAILKGTVLSLEKVQTIEQPILEIKQETPELPSPKSSIGY